jgi:hypothetical protein
MPAIASQHTTSNQDIGNSPPPLSTAAQKATIPIRNAVPAPANTPPTPPIGDRSPRPQDPRPGRQLSSIIPIPPTPTPILNLNPNLSRTPSPGKPGQTSRENMKILHPGVLRHTTRQDAAHRDQRGGMRDEEDGLGGALLGRERGLGARDLRVQVGDHGVEGRREAVVQVGDGFAVRGGEEVRGVGGGFGCVMREEGWKVGAQDAGRAWGRVGEVGCLAEPFAIASS